MLNRIGRHIDISHGIAKTPQIASIMKYNIFQIFTTSPQRLAPNKKSIPELMDLRNQLDTYDMYMIIHGSYTINLCHSYGTTKYNSSINSLVHDLKTSEIIGTRCLGIIIHMGKNIKENNLSREQSIINYIHGVKNALQMTPVTTTIVLETGASQGTEVGSKLEELQQIYNGFNPQEKTRIMFCVDTCHIWATGYDISDVIGAKNFFKEFENRIGINKISCIHFNDSKVKCGSKVDRHADLGYGEIGELGLKYIAQFATNHHIPLIMETPIDSVNMKTNRDITAYEELSKVKSWIKMT